MHSKISNDLGKRLLVPPGVVVRQGAPPNPLLLVSMANGVLFNTGADSLQLNMHAGHVCCSNGAMDRLATLGSTRWIADSGCSTSKLEQVNDIRRTLPQNNDYPPER